MWNELQEKGFIKYNIGNLSLLKDFFYPHIPVQDWTELELIPPQEIVDSCLSFLKEDLELNSFTPYIKSCLSILNTGYSIPPHSDMSPFSPWLAQLFLKREEEKSAYLYFGNQKEFKSYPIESGDLYFFYTYPSDFICSIPLIETPLYVINLLPSFEKNKEDNWIFKDVFPNWS